MLHVLKLSLARIKGSYFKNCVLQESRCFKLLKLLSLARNMVLYVYLLNSLAKIMVP